MANEKDCCTALTFTLLHLESGEATKKSAGVCYAMLLANSMWMKQSDWEKANRAIMAGLKVDVRGLDQVKKTGMDLHGALIARLKQQQEAA